MKLLLLVHDLSLGGTEKMVCNLARNFRKRRWSVVVACLDEVGELGVSLQKEGYACPSIY